MTKEVEINGKKIGENTQVKMNLKTLIWILSLIIGVVITIFTYTYLDTINKFDNYKVDIKKEQTIFLNKIDKKIEKLNNRDINFLERFGKVEGNIKVILDRTNNQHSSTFTESDNIIPPEN